MVDIPNDPGVPSVAPETRSDNDYQQIDPKAGAGLAQVGQSAVDLSKVFGQVQTDNVTANALQQAQGVLDNYSQMRGLDAVHGQADAQQQIEGIFNKAEGGLTSLDQVQQFQGIAREYQTRYFGGKIAEMASAAKTDYTNATLKLSVDTGNNLISADPASESAYDAGQDLLTKAFVRNLQLNGNASDPKLLQEAVLQSRATGLKTRLQSWAISDPSAALAYAQKNQTTLGADYPGIISDLQKRVQTYALPSIATNAATDVLSSNAPLSGNDAQWNLESGGNQFGPDGVTPLTSPKGAIGAAQMLPDTAQATAAAHGIAWDPNKFRTDAGYNKNLGNLRMADLEQQFGSYPVALAAYNAGPNNPGVVHFAQTGDMSQLPPETLNYVLKLAPGGGQQGGASSAPAAPPSLDQIGANLSQYQAQAYDRAAAQFPNDPEMAADAGEKASNEVARLYGEQKAARDNQIGAQFNIAMDDIQQNKFTNPTDLIKAGGPGAAAYASLPLDKQQSADAVMAKNVPGAQTVWTPQAQQTNDSLLGLAYTDPAAFTKVDLTSPQIINTLPREMIQTLSTKQAEIAKGIYQGVSPDQMNGALSYVAPMLASAGIPTTDRGDPAGQTYKSNAQYQQFAGAYGQDIQAYFAKNGRMPDAADMRSIASRLLIQGTVAGTGGMFFGPKSERLYQAEGPGGDMSKFRADIPASDLQGINAAYEKQFGHPPDLETATQIYLQNQGPR